MAVKPLPPEEKPEVQPQEMPKPVVGRPKADPPRSW